MEYKVIIGRMLFFFPKESKKNLSPSRVRFLDDAPSSCGDGSGYLVDQKEGRVEWYARGTSRLADLTAEHVRFLSKVAKFFGKMEEFERGEDFWFCVDSAEYPVVLSQSQTQVTATSGLAYLE
jgi:hypothetical protein